jgi:hypothetical protein
MNTSPDDIPVNTSTSMLIGMPSFFSSTDISKMGITITGWKVTSTGDNGFTLVPTAPFTWQAGAPLTFKITNVACSQTPPPPPLNEPGTAGTVNLAFTNPSYLLPLTNQANLNLVWPLVKLSYDWKVFLSTNFTPNGTFTGNGSVSAAPGSTVVPLMTATYNATGDKWNIGYVFNYTSKPAAEIAAVFGDPEPVSALDTLDWITTSGSSVYYYTDGSNETLTVNFP